MDPSISFPTNILTSQGIARIRNNGFMNAIRVQAPSYRVLIINLPINAKHLPPHLLTPALTKQSLGRC